jgi:hypothetical protein
LARFAALAVAIVLALLVLGFVPTRRLAGDAGVAAMGAGCAIGFAAAVLAGVLLTVVDAPTAEQRMRRAFLAMVVRLAAVVALGLAAVLSGLFARTPLLLWLATTYIVLLPLEVLLAIRPESRSFPD